MKSKKVRFNGTEYWLVNGHALAPLDQCDDKGVPTIEASLYGESYAHVFGSKVMRHGEVIGKVEDLVPCQ